MSEGVKCSDIISSLVVFGLDIFQAISPQPFLLFVAPIQLLLVFDAVLIQPNIICKQNSDLTTHIVSRSTEKVPSKQCVITVGFEFWKLLCAWKSHYNRLNPDIFIPGYSNVEINVQTECESDGLLKQINNAQCIPLSIEAHFSSSAHRVSLELSKQKICLLRSQVNYYLCLRSGGFAN